MPKFTLPKLPYAVDALEPYMDAKTVEIHHGKHHNAYVDKLNTALEKAPELSEWTIERLLTSLAEVPETIRTAVRNNGGGHANHALFWRTMGKGKGGEPKGDLAAAIAKTFGSFDGFKTQFSTAATNHFGSGWTWLSWDRGNLAVHTTANQDSPLSDGRRPLLPLDLWEHAYYLKYQNRRPEFIAAWWNVVDWDAVGELYQTVRG